MDTEEVVANLRSLETLVRFPKIFWSPFLIIYYFLKKELGCGTYSIDRDEDGFHSKYPTLHPTPFHGWNSYNLELWSSFDQKQRDGYLLSGRQPVASLIGVDQMLIRNGLHQKAVGRRQPPPPHHSTPLGPILLHKISGIHHLSVNFVIEKI